VRNKESFTVEIAGGLGNQLFMFYAGLFFQEHFKKEVTFDVSDFSRIEALHPGANIQTLGLLDDFRTINRPHFPSQIVERTISGFKQITKKNFQKEVFVSKEIGYSDPNLILPSVTKIRGYFQSWIYFHSLQDKPVLSLASLQNPSKWLIDKLETAKKERVLSLHIRRGDYALPANRTSGILSRQYFEKAIEQCSAYDSIWVFTDSPKVVEKEFADLNSSFEIVTPPSDSDPVESMLLMSATHQIVISNSTFSWWSAMLATDSTVVIAPSKWFELRDDPFRLIPDTWFRASSDWVKR
jgi:hypothetical protein